MALDQNTVVWASAGTGKTRKLVEVYLTLLEKNIEPHRILAMTFTEKAAAEMRDRIRSAIYARVSSLPVREHGRWMRILGMLPAAPIGTIHGFCARVLRERGLCAGIDPSFSILSEQRSLDLARESVIESLRVEIRSGQAGICRLFGDFGLEKLVQTVVAAGYWLKSLGKDATWLDERVDTQQTAADTLRLELAPYFEKYGSDFDAIGILADEIATTKARHPLKNRDDPRAALPRMGQIAGVEVARDLCQLTRLALSRFRCKKQSLNVLDFDDLLLNVRDLLRQHPEVCTGYQRLFQVLLVDEFQDTDEVQATIIELLARDEQTSTTRGPDAVNGRRFAPGKLMVVGDPKQSIYRFRRARVTVFFRMLDEILKDGGTLVHLRENRRSAPQIAEFANLLSYAMMDGLGKGPLSNGVIDLSYRIKFSEADRLVPKSESPFLGITYVAADSGVAAAAGRNMEAEALARLLKQWKSSGLIESWKEVAMLFRVTSNMTRYLDALEEHGIPVHVVQGTNFYQKTEVSDLIAVLELILHPEDPFLRAIVLSSSIAGLTMEELLEGRSSAWLDGILKPWFERRDTATAAEILEDVVRRTNIDVVMMAQKNGPRRVANIGKLIEITRDLARQGTAALDDVVRHLRERAHDPTVRESEAQVTGQEGDVVRLLTVHQAKGLEFDIVIIPDLAVKTGRGSGDRTFFSDHWGLLAGSSYGLHRKPLPHALILKAKEEEDDQQYEEEKRLLYVAVTRAKKMLVLGEGFTRNSGPWLKWVQNFLERIQPGAIDRAREGKIVKLKIQRSGVVPEFTVNVVPASMLNLPEQLSLPTGSAMIGSEAVVSDLRNLRDRVLAPQGETWPVLEITPSDLTALDGCFRFFHWTHMLGIAEPGTESTGDTRQMRLGSAVHKLLETGIAPPPIELAQLGLSDLEALFNSREWKTLQNASPEPELPFMMHVRALGKDCWIRGRMDAVIGGEVPTVIDYKYALWRDGIDASYEIQLTAYALAAMKSFGADRAIGELWYLRSPMKIVRHEYSAATAEERLVRLIESYSRALETGDWPMAERDYCDRMECGFRSECFKSAIRNPTPKI
jgi:ATP-dependent helicase/nuclease subunit A